MARGKAAGRLSPARRRSGGDAEGERWLTTYADAITLLLAFFVMLYAMSQVDVVKFEAFLRGLAVPFQNAAGADGLLEAQSGVVGDGGSQSAPPASESQPPGVSLQDQAPEPQPTESEAEEGGDGEQLPEDLEKIREELEAALTKAGLPNVADYRRDERGLVVSIGTDDVLFELGSAAITSTGRGVINAIAPTLARYPNDIFVEGHTDNVPISRPGYTNWNLSTDRAVAVLTMLVTEHGISPPRLAAAGYGEFRPRVPNDSAAHRSLNRRVEIVIVSSTGG
ncbi:MAG TPA: flagellar motor protein MotB [Egibacteraceae bacterium]